MVVYAAGVVYCSWPLPAHLASSLILATGGIISWERLDVDLNAWILAWGSHSLATDPGSFFDANIFHPAKLSLATGEHFLGLQPIAAPVFWITGNAVLAYNLTILLVAWLTAVLTFVAVRSLTGSAAAGFVSGAVFTFAPIVARDFGRMNESPVVLFPVILLLTWKAAESWTPRLLVAIAFFTAWQALAGMYIAFELALLALAFAPAVLWRAREHGNFGLAPLIALGVGLAVLIPLSIPYLDLKASGSIPSGKGAAIAVDLLSTSVGDNALRVAREVTWPVVALALLGLVMGPPATRPLRLGLASIAVLGILVAAGTKSPGVYQLFRAVLPGFENMRLPSRLLVISVFAVALASGLGVAGLLARLRGTSRAAAASVALLVGVALFLRAPVSEIKLRPMPRKAEDFALYDWLGQQDSSGAVLELPIYGSPHEAGVAAATGQYMVGSSRHWKPLLNGYSGYFPANHVVSSVLGNRLPDPRAFHDLCDFIDFEWVVVHGNLTPRAYLFLDVEIPIEPVTRFGRAAVYRVTRECGGLTERLAAEIRGERAGRTLRDAPMEELSVEARRGLVRPKMPKKFVAGLHQYVPTKITNLSSVTWPGLSTQAEHRVAVESRWIPKDGRPPIAAAGAKPLMADLAPGETITVWVPVYPPRAGSYTLEIGLLQTGPGWFVDSGGTGLSRKEVTTQPLTFG